MTRAPYSDQHAAGEHWSPFPTASLRFVAYRIVLSQSGLTLEHHFTNWNTP